MSSYMARRFGSWDDSFLYLVFVETCFPIVVFVEMMMETIHHLHPRMISREFIFSFSLPGFIVLLLLMLFLRRHFMPLLVVSTFWPLACPRMNVISIHVPHLIKVIVLSISGSSQGFA